MQNLVSAHSMENPHHGYTIRLQLRQLRSFQRSSIFLYERIDSTLESESYLISKYLVDNAQGINKMYPSQKSLALLGL